MKIGMLFPDYGSQFVGMVKELYDESRIIQEFYEEASNCLNINFIKLCFASSDAELSKITHAYVAIFLNSVALAAVLKDLNISPHVVAGCGIGEMSALCAANGISFPDGLYFLNKYATFYQDLLVTLPATSIEVSDIAIAKVKKICAKSSTDTHRVSPAIIFNNKSLVISGAISTIEMVSKELKKLSALVKPFPIEAGLHNTMMDSVVEQLKLYRSKIDFKDIQIPIIMSVDGREVIKGDLIKNRIIKQLHHPILWNKVMEHCHDWDIIIEIGPGHTLKKVIQEYYPEKNYISINKRSDIDQLQTMIQNVSTL